MRKLTGAMIAVFLIIQLFAGVWPISGLYGINYIQFEYNGSMFETTDTSDVCWLIHCAPLSSGVLEFPHIAICNGEEKRVYGFSDGAFDDCGKIKRITVSADCQTYYISGNCLIYTKDKMLMLGCDDSVIPNDGSVTSIGNYAFENCTAIKSVSLPTCLTGIGVRAFAGCTGLKSIYIPENVSYIGVGVLSGCKNLESITVSGQSSYYRCTGNCLVEISTGNLLAGCNNSVIPDDGTVKSIDGYSFIKNNKSEGYGAFCGCSELKSINIPDSVENIGPYAFCGCSALTKVIVPNGVKEIPCGAFMDCSSLLSVKIPDSVTSIGLYAFKGCENLSDIELPDGLLNLDGVAFEKCKSIKSVKIPNGVSVIYSATFRDCTGLESVVLSDNLVAIDCHAFAGCSSLKSIYIPDSVTKIELDAFRDCKNLTEITIPDKVTVIYSWTFQNCTNIKEIVLPAGITTIWNNAFFGCTSLEKVYFKGSEQQWNDIKIEDGNDLLMNAEIVFDYKPRYAPGDCNEDRQVNNRDVVLLFRYASGSEKVEDEYLYDFDGNGEVNNKDVVELFRFVSKAM